MQLSALKYINQNLQNITKLTSKMIDGNTILLEIDQANKND